MPLSYDRDLQEDKPPVFAARHDVRGALAALAVLVSGLEFDRGRSIGKQLLGLRLMTPRGEECSYARSFVRNFPLIVPLWNLIELGFILAGRPRTGDRIARTTVTEE